MPKSTPVSSAGAKEKAERCRRDELRRDAGTFGGVKGEEECKAEEPTKMPGGSATRRARNSASASRLAD